MYQPPGFFDAVREGQFTFILFHVLGPSISSLDEIAETAPFVANADLTEYDLSELQTVLFEFQPKSERVNMRLPKPLLDAVKASAIKAGVPYQRFIRQVLEAAVRDAPR